MDEQRQKRAQANSGSMPRASRPPATSAGQTPMAMTPKEIIRILRQHILLIILMTILGIIMGGTAWFLLLRYAPKYTAQTYIKVLPPIEKDPMKLGGVQVNKDIQYGHRQSIATLIRQQSTLQNLLKRDKIQDTDWFKHFATLKDDRIKKAFKKLRKRFRASAHRDAEFVTLSMTCGDAEESALIVNEMVNLFITSRGNVTKGEVRAKLTKLTEQKNRLENELRLAERGLGDIIRDTGFTDLRQRTNFRDTVTLKLDGLEIDRNKLELDIQQIQAIVANFERQATGPVGTQVEHQIENDPIMLALAQRRNFLEAALAGSLTKFGENHPSVSQRQVEIDQIREKRQARKAEIAEQTRRANFQNAQDQLVILTNEMERLELIRKEAFAEKERLDLARRRYELQTTKRDERQVRLEECELAIERQKALLNDPTTPKVLRVGPAPPPLEVSSPKWEIFFPGGMVLGLAFGLGLAFLIELLNDLVRTPRDVIRHLGVGLLAVIPDADEDRGLRNIDLYHVLRQSPYSILSEAYRKFRTNLRLSTTAGSSKVLLVSSGMAGDGKTSVVSNLAASLIAGDKKVLVIDANFWRPALNTIFPKLQPENQTDQVNNTFGLSTHLAGLCGYHEIIRPSDIEGLDVIDSGPLPPNPTELLGGRHIEQLIQHQRQSYDYIIIDGPPILLVSAAKILARMVDGTILVFNAGATRRGAAQRTITELRQVNAKIAGGVLFAVRAMKGGYFQEQFDSYQEYQKLQLAAAV